MKFHWVLYFFMVYTLKPATQDTLPWLTREIFGILSWLVWSLPLPWSFYSSWLYTVCGYDNCNKKKIIIILLFWTLFDKLWIQYNSIWWVSNMFHKRSLIVKKQCNNFFLKCIRSSLVAAWLWLYTFYIHLILWCWQEFKKMKDIYKRII